MTTKKKRTLLGQKIRRLRQDRALTQQEMAAQLGISASYLNLIEHDERPATVSLLLKLAQIFGIDLNTLSDDSERRLAAALGEVFADAGLADKDIDSDEIARLVTSAPKAARAIADLYRALRAARDDAQALNIDLSDGRKQRVVLPTEEARDFFESRANHFPAIEAAAETLGLAPDSEIGRAHGRGAAPLRCAQPGAQPVRGAAAGEPAFPLGIPARPVGGTRRDRRCGARRRPFDARRRDVVSCRTGELFRGCHADALCAVSRGGRGGALRRRTADASFRRFLRAGGAPAVDAEPAGQRGHPFLLRARRHRRQYQQAVLGGGLPFFALWRRLPALHRP